VATVAQRLVWNPYAVSTVTLLCATLARLRSTSIVFHWVYRYTTIVSLCAAVCACGIYPIRRLGLTYYGSIVVGYYQQRRRLWGRSGGGALRPDKLW